MMNEAETRAELIDKQLEKSGWKSDSLDVRVRREYPINAGELQNNGKRKKNMIADYVLEYKNTKLAVIEAKSVKLDVGEGVAQAKEYAKKLNLSIAFSANGKEIYQIIREPHSEGKIASFPTPQELWALTHPDSNAQFEKFSDVPFEAKADHSTRYYQEIAVNKAMQAVANGEKRILLTLATGTGKTFIASQIAWKLFNSKWALKGERRPRILFLADRNILASQALTGFGAFDDDALLRITPSDIAKRGEVPTNANVFFAIFQAFMSGKEKTGKHYYEGYEKDFFDFIIIDECHRGGANNESTWRGILEYFESAVQLGLTATPKRDDNRDTYAYFGEPVFTYSLKEGIEDGFLTPFQVRYFKSNIDEYAYHPDDDVDGEIEVGKIYTESEINKKIKIDPREQERVNNLLKSIKPNDKTIVFCASQAHAAVIRDFINQTAQRGDDYCVRVTSEDGPLGDTHLQQFRDNEKTRPTILTTSQKLTTGVDALNVRNIVLLRPINSMVEFKQIIGRGTRIYEGKNYFTVIDFVEAYKNFKDPEWDGQAVKLIDGDSEKIIENSGDEYSFDQESIKESVVNEIEEAKYSTEPMITVKLSDERERQIKSIQGVLFEVAGNYVEPEPYLKWLYDDLRLPELLGSEENLCETWGNPEKRKEIMQKLEEAGCPKEHLEKLKTLIEPQDNDIFDVLGNVAYARQPISRIARVEAKKMDIYKDLNDKEKYFATHILSNYIKSGDEELNSSLSDILKAIYGTTQDARQELGEPDEIRRKFIKIQQQLYA